jgi:hypothetical protein
MHDDQVDHQLIPRVIQELAKPIMAQVVIARSTP